mgnify:CR=1 FL=1
MSKQPKQETLQPVATLEAVGGMQKPVMEFHSGQLLTIYTELNTILTGLEEKYRYCPDTSMNGDTPRRDFVTTRFVRLKKICDNISSYLLDMEDYKDAVCECFAYMTDASVVETVPERKLGVG